MPAEWRARSALRTSGASLGWGRRGKSVRDRGYSSSRVRLRELASSPSAEGVRKFRLGPVSRRDRVVL